MPTRLYCFSSADNYNVDSKAMNVRFGLESVDLGKPEAVRPCRAVDGEHLPTTFDARIKTKVQAINLFRSQRFEGLHSLRQEFT